jgi:SH3-like domain-containing protein
MVGAVKKLKNFGTGLLLTMTAILPAAVGSAPMGSSEGGNASADVSTPTTGPSSGLPVPRYAALSASEVNFRKGPGEQYPITWVYRREGWPVKVVREFGDWRRVIDMEGYEGWVKENLLSAQRSAVVLGATRLMFSDPDTQSRPLWRVQQGVTGKIVVCEDAWCQLNIDGKTGYILRVNIWGTEKDENFN